MYEKLPIHIKRGILRSWIVGSITWIIISAVVFCYEPLKEIANLCYPNNHTTEKFPTYMRFVDHGEIMGGAAAANYYSEKGCFVTRHEYSGEQMELLKSLDVKNPDGDNAYYEKNGIKLSLWAKYLSIMFLPPLVVPILLYGAILVGLWILRGYLPDRTEGG
jgi:hypothetical protein